MKRCPVCGSKQVFEKRVQEIFQIEGVPVLVENIPAEICPQCGEVTFSLETTETVRRMVHGTARPVRSVQMDVFEFA